VFGNGPLVETPWLGAGSAASGCAEMGTDCTVVFAVECHPACAKPSKSHFMEPFVHNSSYGMFGASLIPGVGADQCFSV
jgi:hypothetical protein